MGVFLGILDVVSVSDLGCLAWVFIKEQVESVHTGNLKGLGETIQGFVIAFI